MRLALLLLGLTLPGLAAAAQPIAGKWLTDDGAAVVEIGRCGPAVCGRIERILKPNGPPVDRNNPDPALRNRPLAGLTILSGFTEQGHDWRGSIYDPKTGKIYRSILTRQAPDRLKVQGCIAIFCQTQRWTAAR